MLSADFLHLEKDVRMVNAHADLFHLDVMDGTLVPNISYGFPVVEAIASIAEKPLDAHLMIVHPEKYFERFARAGVQYLSFHYEAAREDSGALLEQVRSLGMKAGLAINPDIPAETVFPYLDRADFILVMSVFAGFGGQRFIEETYGRIRSIRDEIRRQGTKTLIEVDGGVSPANAKALVRAGASMLVAGSSVFRAEDPAAAIAAMRG